VAQQTDVCDFRRSGCRHTPFLRSRKCCLLSCKKNLTGRSRRLLTTSIAQDRHGDWDGRVETSGIAGHKAGRETNRGQPSRWHGRPKSGSRQPSCPTPEHPTARRTPCRPRPARGAASGRRFDSRRERRAAVGLGSCRVHARDHGGMDALRRGGDAAYLRGEPGAAARPNFHRDFGGAGQAVAREHAGVS
jgi:hypothetical protein